MKKTLLIILAFALLMAALFGLAALKERLMPREEPLPAAEAEVSGWANELDEVHATRIDFMGTEISVRGLGASVSGSTVTIAYPGTYILSGTLTDGQIVVDCDHDGKVYLELAAAAVSCSYGPPLMVLQAQDTVLVLAEGTENCLDDSEVYSQQLMDAMGQPEAEQPDAAIYSRDDLHIEGEGSLTVIGYYQDAIHCKDDLKFKGGTVRLYAAADGAKGTESLTLEGGTLYVQAVSDGLQSTKGPIEVLDGTVSIRCGGDGLAAMTELSVDGGDIAVTAASGWEYYSYTVMSDTSAKGLKADSIVLRGGTLSLNTADDGVHAESSLVMDGGSLTIWSGDDAMNAGHSLALRGGEVLIEESYEAMEALSLQIAGGSVRAKAENNGLTATLDLLDTEHTADDCGIHISGGIVDVLAGQAVKTDGAFLLENGTAFLQGVNADDEALEAALGGRMTGGMLVVCGSMSAEPVDLETKHGELLHRLTTAAEAGTVFALNNADGELCFQYAPREAYGAVYVAYNGLIDGEDYQIAVAGQNQELTLGETSQSGSFEMGASGPMRPF